MPKKESLDESWEVWVNTLLANPTGPPTVALAIFAFFGFRFIAPKLDLAFQSTEQALIDLDKKLKELYDEKIVEPLVPLTTFADDIKACYISATVKPPWGGPELWLPGYSEQRFVACLVKKGYGVDVVTEALRKL